MGGGASELGSVVWSGCRAYGSGYDLVCAKLSSDGGNFHKLRRLGGWRRPKGLNAAKSSK
jgi:hypothetical protein